MAKYQTSKKRKNKAAGKTSTSVQGLTELACKASGCIPKKRRGVIGQLEAARICFSHPFMKVLPTWYCAIVVKDRSITRPRVILITLPPSDQDDPYHSSRASQGNPRCIHLQSHYLSTGKYGPFSLQPRQYLVSCYTPLASRPPGTTTVVQQYVQHTS